MAFQPYRNYFQVVILILTYPTRRYVARADERWFAEAYGVSVWRIKVGTEPSRPFRCNNSTNWYFFEGTLPRQRRKEGIKGASGGDTTVRNGRQNGRV